MSPKANQAARYVLVRWIDADLSIDQELPFDKLGVPEVTTMETGGWLIDDHPDAVRIALDRDISSRYYRGIYTIPRPFVLKVTVLADLPDATAPPKRKPKPPA